MDERQSELLKFFYDNLFTALDRRTEQHRQIAEQSQMYIRCKNQLQALIDNSDDEAKIKLLEFEELKTQLESISTSTINVELKKDLKAILRLLLKMLLVE